MKRNALFETPHKTPLPVIDTPGINLPTSDAKGNTSAYIFALSENRHREVGVAVLDTEKASIELSQFKETHAYSSLRLLIHLYSPREIIFPANTSESHLAKVLKLYATGSKLDICQRKYFNETKGLLYLRQLSASALPHDLNSSYLALGSVAAVIKYAELTRGITYTNQSLSCKVHSSLGKLALDIETIQNLELIENRSGSREKTLFGVLNHTSTAFGAKRLIAEIVQPPNDKPTILLRQQAVAEILEHSDVFFAVRPTLKLLSNLDSIVSQFAQGSRKNSISSAQTQIQAIINFRIALERVQMIVPQLSSLSSQLCTAIRENLQHEKIDQLKESLAELFNPDALGRASNAKQVHEQVAFAVKPSLNGMLDVARRTYCEATEDIQGLLEEYKRAFDLPGLKLTFNAKRGYFLTLSFAGSVMAQQPTLPKLFLQVSKQKGKFSLTTEELLSLNHKSQESFNEIIMLTNQILEGSGQEIRRNLSLLYQVVDSLSLLDFLLSLAGYAMSIDKSFQPEIIEWGPLAFRQSRHPILEKILPAGEVIPNDIFAGEGADFVLLTGPNMAGKSTYLRQVVLLVILTHIGAHVPALWASVPLFQQCLTRIGTGDCIEENASTFFKEMQESATIIENCESHRCLMIIDELGRATSTRDGLALSWAISERILTRSIGYCFFVTHFHELTALAQLYPNAKNFHLLVDSRGRDKPLYLHTVEEGPLPETSYGLVSAAIVLPPEVIENAQQIRVKLVEKIQISKAALQEKNRL